jgi:hypothetical protein
VVSKSEPAQQIDRPATSKVFKTEILKAASNGNGGIRSPKVPSTTLEQTSDKSITKPLQTQTSQEVTKFEIEQKQTNPQQNHDTNLHKKRATDVHFESSDSNLKIVIDTWLDLPEHIRQAIMVLIKAYL